MKSHGRLRIWKDARTKLHDVKNGFSEARLKAKLYENLMEGAIVDGNWGFATFGYVVCASDGAFVECEFVVHSKFALWHATWIGKR